MTLYYRLIEIVPVQLFIFRIIIRLFNYFFPHCNISIVTSSIKCITIHTVHFEYFVTIEIRIYLHDEFVHNSQSIRNLILVENC